MSGTPAGDRHSHKVAFSRLCIESPYAVNLRQLEYFVVIAEEGSLTGAAKRLLVAQPVARSRSPRSSPRSAGRRPRAAAPGVRLTAAGERFLGEARSALAHADAARRGARMALDLEAGELQIATIPSVAAGVLPPAMRRGPQLHPSVEIGLREYTHRRLMDEAMRDGEGDLGVGMVPADWLGPVEPLGWEEFVVVLPEGDPLLGARSVRLEALSDRRWVHFQGDHGLAEIVDILFAAAGFAPRVAVRTSHVAPAPIFAAAGLGPALVPERIVPESLRPLARVLRPRRAAARGLRARVVARRAGLRRAAPRAPLARAPARRGRDPLIAAVGGGRGVCSRGPPGVAGSVSAEVGRRPAAPDPGGAMSDVSGTGGDAAEQERELREHEREARERDPDERDGGAGVDPAADEDDPAREPAPPGSVPTSGQP